MSPPPRRIPAAAIVLGALAIVVTIVLGAAVIQRRHVPPRDPTANTPKVPDTPRTHTTTRTALGVSDAAFPQIRPTRNAPSPPHWCTRALPRADARAIDPHGHVFALVNGTVRDETAAGSPVTLAHENPPCRATLDALAFHRSGAAMAIVRGRIHLKAADLATWTETPLCTDLGGDPWAEHENGRGWTVVVRRIPGIQPMLMSTTEHAGAFSWAAYTPFEVEAHTAVVDQDGSNLRIAGRQVLFVDRVNSVAGTVGVIGEDPFELLTRTNAGIVLAHDIDSRSRSVVVSPGLQGRFRRARYARPEGAVTRAVFLSDYGVLIAVTDRGVEWAGDEYQPFLPVATWPDPAPDGGVDPDPASGAAFGWLEDGKPAIATRTAILSSHCPI